MTAAGVGQMQPGEVLDGRYRIEGTLGQGGFGVVYRATQLDLGRTVAIKVMLPSAFMNPEAITRFRREAELTQHLTHPNTVTLYAYGQSTSGAPYTVWEMLSGQPLDAVLRTSGPMSVGRVRRIGEQVLKSLIEAHEAGIVHRDIKPANLFLCQFAGEPDFIKVLDFGIAAVGDASSGQLTKEGQSVGTPSYMSPEQVVGDLDVDRRSDLYALGLVLAEMLTGQIVMQGSSGMRICIEQMSDNPVPIPPEVLHSPLGPVIARATQKKRDQRYATATDMLAELQACGGADSKVIVVTGAVFGPNAPTMGAAAPTGTGPTVAAPSVSTGGAGQVSTSGMSVTGVSTPPGGAPVQAKPAMTKWVVGGAIALALVGGTIGVAAWSPWDGGSAQASNSADDDSGARADKKKKKSKKGKKLDAPKAKRTKVKAELEDFEVRGKSAQSLVDELADRHFEMKMDPYVNKAGPVTAINYVFGHTLGDSGGTIQFHRYRKSRGAKAAARLQSGTMATRTDGNLMVGFLIDRDLKKSNEMLDELLK